jgi:hypothetical protein
MIEVLNNGNTLLTHSGLIEQMKRFVRGFDGSVPWYAETVKLDLGARGIVRRFSDNVSSKQVYVLLNNK